MGGIFYRVQNRKIIHFFSFCLQVKLTIPLSSDTSGMAGMKYSSKYLSLSIFGGYGP